MKPAARSLCILILIAAPLLAQPVWQSSLDSKIRFYQQTDLGLVLAGTEKSLYAIDAQTGERIWQRKTGKIQETAVTPVPGTDVILCTQDLGSKSRLTAVDAITGSELWQSDKAKGDVMQLAVDPEQDIVAVVLVRDARGNIGGLKRRPVVHVLALSNGDELWHKDLDSDIEMMPARFVESGDVDYTLDNYRAPLMLDGRLYLFYEGSTSFDARTGKEKQREKFKVNEDGLALTEADPVVDQDHIYVSGRGRVRAINRQSGDEDWKADDLGTAAEIALVGTTLYVRTGGQFTQLKDGDTKEKGPFGVAAIDTTNGKVKWRYKGADKGLTNFAFADENTIVIADRDDVITVDARNGKRLSRREHKVDKAQFVLMNEARHIVVGGRDEIAAFRVGDEKGPEVWRVRHKAPGRGVLKTIAGIALRAAAIYFRYAPTAMSAVNTTRNLLNISAAINGFRWSGLNTRFGNLSLSTLATNAAKSYVTRRIYSYGALGRTRSMIDRFSGFEITIPSARDIRGRVIGSVVDRVKPSKKDVEESIFDRIDPIRQAERVSSFLLRRKRLAELRDNEMYFFTDLDKPFDKKGLVGVNIHTGRDVRFVLVSDPDPDFVLDESTGLVFSSDGSKLQAFDIINR